MMKYVRVLGIILGVFMFFGCTVPPKTLQYGCQKQDCPQISMDGYTQKVDNFLIIFDESRTMNEMYGKDRKLDFAKKLVCRMNEAIPAIKLNGGLRTFGRGFDFFPVNETEIVYGMEAYSKSALRDKIAEKIDYAHGNTAMAKAINAAKEDLQKTEGDIAVIIISDGKACPDPVRAAQQLKFMYGERLCIYTVLVGNDDRGFETMNEVARAGECGYLISSYRLETKDGMADFVRDVFLKEKCKDEPARPAKRPVIEKIVLSAVMFDFDSAEIKSEFRPALDAAAGVLKKHDDKNVIIEGHTDSVGSEQYNQRLSLRRAQSVRNYLVSKGVTPTHLTSKGYGESDPIADNTTDAGRRRNRRVEFVVVE